MNRTKIEYLNFTWNPIAGCSGIGCAVRKECWARAQSKRRKWRCTLCYVFKPHLHKERLHEPLQRKKSSRIGVTFSGDFFDIGMHPNWQQDVLEIIEKCQWHIFILLTKQPQNIPKWFDYESPKNLWIGVSINRKADLWRLEKLKQLITEHKLSSFEPLYEDLGAINLKGIDWVIIGAQTKPLWKPDIAWVQKIMERAHSVNAKVFLKNNLWQKQLNVDSIFDGVPKIQEFPKVPQILSSL